MQSLAQLPNPGSAQSGVPPVSASLAANQPVLARCPDCLGLGGCLLGLPALVEMPAQKCAATGLCRTKLYELTSPTKENEFKPLVESFEERKPGARTGHRMILGASLCRHIRSHRTKPSAKYAAKKAKKLRSPRKSSVINQPAKLRATEAPTSVPKPVTVPLPDGIPQPPKSPEMLPSANTPSLANNPPPPPPPTEELSAEVMS